MIAPTITTLAPMVVWCVLQVTLFALAAGAIYLLVRRFGEKAGAAALATSLVLVLGLTILTASPWPQWQFPSEVTQKTSAPLPSPANESNEEPANNPPATIADQSLTSPYTAAWQAFKQSLASPTVADEATIEEPVEQAWQPLTILAFLALVGLFLSSARLALGVWQVGRLQHRSQLILDPKLNQLAAELGTQLGIESPVALRESTEIATPATIGWLRPSLLLPATRTDWTADETRAVLAHELSHVASRDYRTWLVARVAVAVHFYHPLVRWLASRLQLEQELAADATAARLMGDRRQYLQCLASLALATPAHRLAGPARTLIPSRSLLMRRVEMLRTTKSLNLSTTFSKGLRTAAVGMLACVALIIAGIRQPAIAQESEPSIARVGGAVEKQVDRLPLTLIPPGTVYVATVRPAELMKDEKLAEVMKETGQLAFPESTGLSVADLAEAMVVVPGSVYSGTSIPRFIVRFNSQESCKRYLDYLKTQPGMKPFRESKNVWRDTSEQVSQIDDSTLVIDNYSMIEPVGGQLAPLHSHLLPAWHKEWKQYDNRPLVAAINLDALRPVLPKNEQGELLGDAFGLFSLRPLTPLFNDNNWAIAGVDLDDKLTLDAIAQCDSEENAKQIAGVLQAFITLSDGIVEQQKGALMQSDNPAQMKPEMAALAKQAFSLAEEFIAEAKPVADGNRVNLTFSSDKLSSATAATMAQTLIPLVEAAREVARRKQSMNNIKLFVLGMHTYESVYGHFPAARNYAPGSKYPHSWRVAILPYLEGQAIYDQYKFDEPWDSESNKKLIDKMPSVFRSPSDAENSTNTSYFALTGPDTFFHNDEGAKFSEIFDGLSNTIMFVEAKRDIPWTKPEDIPYDADKPLPKLGGFVPAYMLAAFCDGSVQPLTRETDPETLRAYITRNGKEAVKR